MSTTVYVELLDEGVKVWRPVEADEVDPGEYLLNFDPLDDERPAFQTGQRVRCEYVTTPGGERIFAVVENVVLVPTLRVVPGRGKSRRSIEVRSDESPKPSGRPDLDEPFSAWIFMLARTLFPVRPNDDTIITNFQDLTDQRHYRVAFEVAADVPPRRAAEFLIASSEEYGFVRHIELPREDGERG